MLVKSIYSPQVANWRSVPKLESIHILQNTVLWKNCLVKHKEMCSYSIAYILSANIFKPQFCGQFSWPHTFLGIHFDHCCFFSKSTSNTFISKQKHAILGGKYGWNKTSQIIASCFLVLSSNRMAENKSSFCFWTFLKLGMYLCSLNSPNQRSLKINNQKIENWDESVLCY